jgi:hypothetical protein
MEISTERKQNSSEFCKIMKEYLVHGDPKYNAKQFIQHILLLLLLLLLLYKEIKYMTNIFFIITRVTQNVMQQFFFSFTI